MSGARTVLVTRPQADAAPFARRIEALGHRAVIEPLIEVRFPSGAAVDLAGVQVLAFTSANGVRALVHAAPAAPRALAVFAVGEATARTAREAGFTRVTVGGGDVASLARTIVRNAPASGAILHVAGRDRAGDLVGLLKLAGFAARRVVLYAAEPVAALSRTVQEALGAGTIDDVAIFSPRTARQFVTLMTHAGLAPAAGRLRLLALSPRVAEAASGLAFAAVAVAARPDQDALLDLLADIPGTGQ